MVVPVGVERAAHVFQEVVLLELNRVLTHLEGEIEQRHDHGDDAENFGDGG